MIILWEYSAIMKLKHNIWLSSLKDPRINTLDVLFLLWNSILPLPLHSLFFSCPYTQSTHTTNLGTYKWRFLLVCVLVRGGKFYGFWNRLDVLYGSLNALVERKRGKSREQNPFWGFEVLGLRFWGVNFLFVGERQPWVLLLAPSRSVGQWATIGKNHEKLEGIEYEESVKPRSPMTRREDLKRLWILESRRWGDGVGVLRRDGVG